MRGRRRGVPEGFSLSFLDAICCGFGAIVLLLVLTKIGEPRALEQARINLDGLVEKLEQELYEIRGETEVLNRSLISRRQQLSKERELIARLKGDLSRIQGEFAASAQESEVQDIIEGRLLAAQQKLTVEMQRLQQQSEERPRQVEQQLVGGIPVDSEYIIFVIDTSGSMFTYAWPAVMRKMTQVLDAHPKVKGIQIMNDMGQYMFSSYAGKWIPDTPGRRKVILDRLRTWSVFSNSSPVEGITRAIRTFVAPDKKISIYVFGDEFTGRSIDDVVSSVDRINRRDSKGNRLVRIHAVGFPVMFSVSGVSDSTGVRFATLMRILCHRNGGTFVGLHSTRP
ncbi:MAG: VWA domain-containing protein [Thermoanaerobaculia bacterium]